MNEGAPCASRQVEMANNGGRFQRGLGNTLLGQVDLERLESLVFKGGHPDRVHLPRHLETADLLQDAIIEAIIHSAHFAGQALEDLERWVLGIFHNKVLHAERQQYQRVAERQDALLDGEPVQLDNIPGGGAGVDTILELADTMTVLATAMRRHLSAPEQALVWLRYCGDVPLREISERSGLSISALYKRLSVALGKVALHLKRHPDFSP